MNRILLWGDTQTGKTSLIACAFHAEPDRPIGVDRSGSDAEIRRVLWPNWERLRLGRHVGATSAAPIHVELVDDRGEPLVIEDIPGGLVRALGTDDVRQRLAAADAYVVLVEWESNEPARQFNAVLGVRDLLRSKPSALVFTKCDRRLGADDPLWQADGKWWREVAWLSDPVILEAIDAFGDAVWLSSAVGYHEHSAEPAILLGEFGELIPWNVRPRGVAEPFEHVLASLRSSHGATT